MAPKPRPAIWPALANALPGQPSRAPASPPSNRLTLVLGGPGTGKTVFALQILVSGARHGEPGLFVSFARNPAALLESATKFGWNLAELEQQKLVLLLARKPPRRLKSSRPHLGPALEVLRAKMAESGARRIIFDGLDLWLPTQHHPMSALEEVYRIRDWLYEQQFTGVLTASLLGQTAGTAEALMQLAADCTILLRASAPGNQDLRYLHLAKRRGSALVEEDLPFVIGSAGIELFAPRHAGEGRPRAAGLSAPEVVRASGELLGGLQTLDRFLELKQAELDFRLAKQGSEDVCG